MPAHIEAKFAAIQQKPMVQQQKHSCNMRRLITGKIAVRRYHSNRSIFTAWTNIAAVNCRQLHSCLRTYFTKKIFTHLHCSDRSLVQSTRTCHIQKHCHDNRIILIKVSVAALQQHVRVLAQDAAASRLTAARSTLQVMKPLLQTSHPCCCN